MTALGSMSDEEPIEDVYPDQLIAENVLEAAWLRLRRLTNPTLCGRIISARALDLKLDLVMQKGQEL